MIKLVKDGIYLVNGKMVEKEALPKENLENAKTGTMAYKIMSAHNFSGNMDNLKIKFDALASHDITYVGIIQTAKASGLEKFPLSYTLTNCHNSLCSVGGTINEDDHVFGLTSAKKYGGNYVPPHLAVIHQYMREMEASCGKMILGSDSHTRYGALGTMAIGEGGPELVKQILSKTYDLKRPEVCLVYLTGNLKKGVGAQDVAIALIHEVFKTGFVKNKVLEFVGEGIKNISMDMRNGIDVMTTETTCLSSIWETDEKTEEYFDIHKRGNAYKKLSPEKIAYYECAVIIDLSEIEPMIAMPFHPSNAYKISELIANPYEILKKVEEEGQELLKNKSYNLTNKIRNGKIYVEQGIIAGCAGGMYENIAEASEILKNKNIGSGEFSLSVYPSSQPVYKSLVDNGYISSLMDSGAIIKTAFCGPCFGAGDVPSNNSLSIRHTTRNFESREGSKPSANQVASVALMDARSIATTALNGGFLKGATEVDYDKNIKKYTFSSSIYENRVFKGVDNAKTDTDLRYGPNICDWPKMLPLSKDLLLKVACVITDPVTTTDELIPSGETSSYRSNPLKLAEFALSRKDPKYVERAKKIKADEDLRIEKGYSEELLSVFKTVKASEKDCNYGSVIVAVKPGDGSAREQAASCQRVLGGVANIAKEYATKRYRSNLINWGMLPFLFEDKIFENGDYVYIDELAEKIQKGAKEFSAKLIRGDKVFNITLKMDSLTDDEKDIILKGCLINYYANK